MYNNKAKGDIGEIIALEYLKSKKFRILATNCELCGVEVDIIFKDGDAIVFCEVKTRAGEGFGTPAESVNRARQLRYIRAAKYYVMTKRLGDVDVRFDVIAVLNGEVEHLIGAYEV